MEFKQAHRLENLHVSGTRVVFGKCAELAAQGIPVTALTLGQPDFDRIWTISVGDANLLPGTILTALVNFLLIAAALYFFVVMPMNKFNERKEAGKEEEAPKPETNELLGEIRDLIAAANKN